MHALDAAREVNDSQLISAALDAASNERIHAGDVVGAHRLAAQRVRELSARPDEPAAGLEIKANRTLLTRYGREPQSAHNRKRFKTLGLPESALVHFHQAEAADPVEGGHGEMPVNILVKYATSAEQQEAVLAALHESIEVNRFHWDTIGKRAIEVARGAPVSATA